LANDQNQGESHGMPAERGVFCGRFVGSIVSSQASDDEVEASFR